MTTLEARPRADHAEGSEGNEKSARAPQERPVRTLYKSLVEEACVPTDADEATRKQEAKKVMRERGEFLAEHNPAGHKEVLELRTRAKAMLERVKGMRAEARSFFEQGRRIDALQINAEADTLEKETYPALIREAVSLFNTEYGKAKLDAVRNALPKDSENPLENFSHTMAHASAAEPQSEKEKLDLSIERAFPPLVVWIIE